MLNTKAREEYRVDLFGTEAGASWPACEYYTHTRRDYVHTQIALRETKETPYHAEIRLFAQAILGHTAVPVPPQQSRCVVAVLEGLYKSHRLGRSVKVAL